MSQSLLFSFMLLIQQFSKPPGLSLHPSPPHEPHDAGQQYSPVHIAVDDGRWFGLENGVSVEIGVGEGSDIGDSTGTSAIGDTSGESMFRDSEGDGDGDAVSSVTAEIGDADGDGVGDGDGDAGVSESSPLSFPEGTVGGLLKAAETVIGSIFAGILPFWNGLDTAQKEGPVHPVEFGHSPGSSAAVWHLSAFDGSPVYDAPSSSPISPAFQNG